MTCALSVGGAITSCSGASNILLEAQPVANRVVANSANSLVFIMYPSEFTLSKAIIWAISFNFNEERPLALRRIDQQTRADDQTKLCPGNNLTSEHSLQLEEDDE